MSNYVYYDALNKRFIRSQDRYSLTKERYILRISTPDLSVKERVDMGGSPITGNQWVQTFTRRQYMETIDFEIFAKNSWVLPFGTASVQNWFQVQVFKDPGGRYRCELTGIVSLAEPGYTQTGEAMVNNVILTSGAGGFNLRLLNAADPDHTYDGLWQYSTGKFTKFTGTFLQQTFGFRYDNTTNNLLDPALYRSESGQEFRSDYNSNVSWTVDKLTGPLLSAEQVESVVKEIKFMFMNSDFVTR